MKMNNFFLALTFIFFSLPSYSSWKVTSHFYDEYQWAGVFYTSANSQSQFFLAQTPEVNGKVYEYQSTKGLSEINHRFIDKLQWGTGTRQYKSFSVFQRGFVLCIDDSILHYDGSDFELFGLRNQGQDATGPISFSELNGELIFEYKASFFKPDKDLELEYLIQNVAKFDGDDIDYLWNYEADYIDTFGISSFGFVNDELVTSTTRVEDGLTAHGGSGARVIPYSDFFHSKFFKVESIYEWKNSIVCVVEADISSNSLPAYIMILEEGKEPYYFVDNDSRVGLVVESHIDNGKILFKAGFNSPGIAIVAFNLETKEWEDYLSNEDLGLSSELNLTLRGKGVDSYFFTSNDRRLIIAERPLSLEEDIQPSTYTNIYPSITTQGAIVNTVGLQDGSYSLVSITGATTKIAIAEDQFIVPTVASGSYLLIDENEMIFIGKIIVKE